LGIFWVCDVCATYWVYDMRLEL